MMMLRKNDVLELGYFIDDDEIDNGDALQALVDTLDDGLILPCLWERVSDAGKPVSLLDAVTGYNEFSSFVEIPREGIAQSIPGLYGIGFTQAFLEEAGVAPVTYVTIGEDEDGLDRETLIKGGLESLLDNWDSFQYLRKQAPDALQSLRNDPDRQAYVHEMIIGYANDTRTYYELIHEDDLSALDSGDAFAHEWRGADPIHFTLADVQTLYVGSIGDVSVLRTRYPNFRGTFVVLGRD